MSEFEDFEKFERNPNKALDIGVAINDAFEIYKKIALPGGIALLIIMMVVFVVLFTGIGFFVDLETLSEEMKNLKPENLSLQTNLMYSGVLTLITALVSPFIAGILKMAHDADHNEEVKISSIGYYVNSSRFVPIVLTVSVLTLVNSLISNFLTYGFPVIGNKIAILITFPIGILTFIALPLVLFNECNFLKAIQDSIRLTAPRFFIVLVLLVIVYILSLVGLIAFCIGLVFTMPIIYAMQYVIYKSLAE